MDTIIFNSVITVDSLCMEKVHPLSKAVSGTDIKRRIKKNEEGTSVSPKELKTYIQVIVVFD
jgi:hypothetical protein